MRKKTLLTAILIPSALLMFSCSGGGGEGNDNANQNQNGGGGGGSVSTETYLFYSGSVYYVDPQNPNTPQQLTAEDISYFANIFSVVSYDTLTNQYTGYHQKYIFYIAGGKIYRVDTEKSVGTPSPVQVSTITDACKFNKTFEEPPAPEDSYLIVKRTGNDGNCETGDDIFSMVKADMSPTDTPVDLNGKEILDAFATQEAEEIDGFLILENNTLKACDENLTNCIDLKTGVTTANVIRRYNIDDPKYLIKIDNDLYTFTGSTKQLSGSPVVQNYDGKNEIFDDNAMYFVETEISGDPLNPQQVSYIKRLSLNNWNVETLYQTQGSLVLQAGSINILKQTQNYLVFVEQTETGKSVKVLSKSGGNAMEIDSTSSLINDILIVTMDKVFYTKRTPSGLKYCYWGEGDSNATCSDGYVAGGSLGENGVYNVSDLFPVSILVVEDCNNSSFACTGGSLKLLNPNNLTKTTIGNLPNDTAFAGFLGVGNYLLGMINIPVGQETQSDIAFVDIQAPNLIRLTNTTDKDETPLFDF